MLKKVKRSEDFNNKRRFQVKRSERGGNRRAGGGGGGVGKVVQEGSQDGEVTSGGCHNYRREPS